jgi:hypothetical protein
MWSTRPYAMRSGCTTDHRITRPGPPRSPAFCLSAGSAVVSGRGFDPAYQVGTARRAPQVVPAVPLRHPGGGEARAHHRCMRPRPLEPEPTPVAPQVRPSGLYPEWLRQTSPVVAGSIARRPSAALRDQCNGRSLSEKVTFRESDILDHPFKHPHRVTSSPPHILAPLLPRG